MAIYLACGHAANRWQIQDSNSDLSDFKIYTLDHIAVLSSPKTNWNTKQTVG